ncbi:MAG TPA: hydroxymethylbilane synthase [Nitrososphaeraceae archaeon]|nr:hydroxymethylbilane synthase [Nitrososphaeraceae archaeon]
MRNYTVGTRRSKLALEQTKSVVDLLKKSKRQTDIKILKISSSGDLDVRPLYTFDRKGIFEKEIDQAVIDGQADFAVHSAKDVPTELFSDLSLASVPSRSAANDVLIHRNGLKLNELPSGAVIGTSSLRRAVQLLRMRPELKVKPIRGNIETRIKKVETGAYDAIVLAQAGLDRLGLTRYITERFTVTDFVPAAGQGALALICRSDRPELLDLLRLIEDTRSRAELEAERNLLSVVEGGCKFPVGVVALSDKDPNLLTLIAKVFSADGTDHIFVTEKGRFEDARSIGIKGGQRLLDRGIKDFSKSWESALKNWNNLL